MKQIASVFFFITSPIWWTLLVTIEVGQILILRTPDEKLLGPRIYDWLQSK